jgi:hypothetical protein
MAGMAFFRNALPSSDPVADGDKLAWHVPVVSELAPAGDESVRFAYMGVATPLDRSPAADAASKTATDAKETSFQDDTLAVVRFGTVVTSFKRLCLAVRDPRCQRPHLRVLCNLMEHLNRKTGTAFPSRRLIAEEENIQFKTVENVLYDLRRWGYIDWERRAEPDLHKGRLLHYTLPVARWSEEQITEEILKWRNDREDKSPRSDGDSECPPQQAQKVPAPAGEKVPAPAGDSNRKKELEERERGQAPTVPEELRITFENGRIALHGALKAEWLASFDNDDERLRLALLQVTVQPNSPRPLEGQVSGHLAKIVAEKRDKDQRYAKAAQANQRNKSSPTTPRRFA